MRGCLVLLQVNRIGVNGYLNPVSILDIGDVGHDDLNNGRILEVAYLGFWMRIINPPFVPGIVKYDLAAREGKIFRRVPGCPLHLAKSEFGLLTVNV